MKFAKDHLFKLKLLLSYERDMFISFWFGDWEEYWSNKHSFDQLRARMRL